MIHSPASAAAAAAAAAETAAAAAATAAAAASSASLAGYYIQTGSFVCATSSHVELFVWTASAASHDQDGGVLSESPVIPAPLVYRCKSA